MPRTRTPERTRHDVRELIEAAIIDAAAAPGGIPRSSLWAAVAARFADIAPGDPAPAPDHVLRALGMCIVRGDVDEWDGRVVAVAGPTSATG
jgi:hypothetical protein